MTEGFPKFETSSDNKTELVTLRFPKFSSNVTYDPINLFNIISDNGGITPDSSANPLSSGIISLSFAFVAFLYTLMF